MINWNVSLQEKENYKITNLTLSCGQTYKWLKLHQVELQQLRATLIRQGLQTVSESDLKFR